jgi:thioredoxin reductase (NADPH)
MAQIYDSIIIGGGPAGLSAGIYLGRALRSVLILDGAQGRTQWNQLNENYLGFPNGIRAAELVRRGRRQAERFGVEFAQCEVRDVARETGEDGFRVAIHGERGGDEKRARTLIFATGVTDVWPSFPHVRRYVGKSLFWCLSCDGFRTCGKRVVVLGNSDEAATTALQMLNYTRRITFLSADQQSDISSTKQSQLQENGIPLCYGRIARVEGKAGQLRALHLEDASSGVGSPGEVARLELDCLFSMMGQVPNSHLAARLGVHLSEKGCIRVDEEQATNLPGVFAAGDVTNLPAQQVASAVHQGALAATAANYFLYSDVQKTPELAAKPPG